MVLRSEFLPRLKFREDEFGGFMPKQLKNDSLGVVNMFSRETLHVSYDRWKNLEVHCNNDQSIHHSPLSKSDSTKHKLLELSFNRLQPTEEHCGLKKHSFGRFVAREAMLAEEYWAASWLRAEAHCESLSGMRLVFCMQFVYMSLLFIDKLCCLFPLHDSFQHTFIRRNLQVLAM
nr:uncharacterized protein LOC109160134 [Ipomoea batatas]